MERSVFARLKYTPDDSLRVAKFIRNKSFVYRHDVLLTSALVFVLFILIIVFMADDLSAVRVLGATVFSSVPAIMAGLAVFALHKVFNPWLMRRTIVKYFESSPTANAESLVVFSDEGFTAESDLGSSHTKWPAIVKVEESESDILFYSGNKLSWFVPKSAFKSSDDLNAFRDLLPHSLADGVQGEP